MLIVNLGTPEATDYWSMRRYLKEFLSDRRVIETPRWLWWPILNLVILTRRPGAEGQGLRVDLEQGARRGAAEDDHARRRPQARGAARPRDRRRADRRRLGDALRQAVDREPARARCSRRAATASCWSPLYPQYCAATTATVCDKAFDALKAMRWQPTLRVAAPYYDDPAYIDALAASTRASLAKLDFEPEVMLASFHGIPQDYFDKGDPYYCHCAKTTRLLREALGLDDKRLRMSFQSRFGGAEWLKPYTDETVKALAQEGVKRLAVITPGFAADCLETLEEIGVENAEYFHDAGGEKFAAMPCLNDSDEGLDVLETVARRELMGWA